MKGFRLAFRHLLRQRLNSTLHIVGLTLGISVCLLIGLFIHYELTFDSSQRDAERIYRINSIFKDGARADRSFSTPMPLADELRREVTGLEMVTLSHPVYEPTAIVEVEPGKRFKQERMMIADPSFPEIFNITPRLGNPAEVLTKPYHALLTVSAAKKFFGTEDPIGKTFMLKNKFSITVGCVIEDIPSNTHLPATVILSYTPNEEYLGHGLEGWNYVSGTSTYVKVPAGYDLRSLQSSLDRIAARYMNKNAPSKQVSSAFDIQPLNTIHFDARYSGGSEWVKAVSKSWLWFFASIGIAVLTLACINFVNLSTAQALTRAREVGVLKTVGANRFNLISQFLREAWILAFTAGLLAIGLSQIALPYMNTILNKDITFSILESPLVLAIIVTGVFTTGLLAGIYPAYIIARFNPAITLKATSGSVGSSGSSWVRKGLVVVQFVVSAGLLISVLAMSQQVDYLRSREIGFDHENILNVPIQGADKAQVFKNEILRIPGVVDVSFATATPSNNGHWGTIMSPTNGDDPARQHITMILADDNFCRMYGFKLLAGRLLVPQDTSYASDKLPREQQIMRVVVNESTVRGLGFSSNEEAINRKFWIGMNSGNAEIVGVVADFNTSSLHEAIKPTLIMINYRMAGQAGIKLAAGIDLPSTTSRISDIWNKVYTTGVFEYKFLNDQLDAFYKAESNLYALFRIFATIAILISCLGLWGLSAFSAQQRTKEIGIRRVLGASVNTIVVLLSRDFLLLVVVSIVVAIPLSTFFLNQWLQNFAFHITLGWRMFTYAAVASVFIAMVTVCTHSVKAALANPTDSLKTE
ncbi:FtsX-like permease family protein [Chryseolinea sp. T2]|uniref:FtsX-like permease family protein n=1 Tax=Chryseolinea sp. T2 TaxID=3129255 RepID=UPI003077F5E5